MMLRIASNEVIYKMNTVIFDNYDEYLKFIRDNFVLDRVYCNGVDMTTSLMLLQSHLYQARRDMEKTDVMLCELLKDDYVKNLYVESLGNWESFIKSVDGMYADIDGYDFAFDFEDVVYVLPHYEFRKSLDELVTLYLILKGKFEQHTLN